MTEEKRAPRKGENYLSTAFGSLIIVLAVKYLIPDLIPFSFLEFWRTDGLWFEVVLNSWPIFIWGSGVTFLAKVLTRNKPEVNRGAEGILVLGALISAWAGVVEEICFRWFIFYGEIVGYHFFNWLTFGLLAWIFVNITGPVADFFTLGYLHSILYGPYGWAVGSAILSSNGKFRNGHQYLGIFGWVNSWFLGMFFFYLMFTYGLPAAILVHFLYDLFIFCICYLDAVVERSLGWT